MTDSRSCIVAEDLKIGDVIKGYSRRVLGCTYEGEEVSRIEQSPNVEGNIYITFTDGTTAILDKKQEVLI